MHNRLDTEPRFIPEGRLRAMLVTALILLSPVHVVAEDRTLAELFARQGAEGTIVISSLGGDRTFIHNDARAGRRFSPGSTFKIPNTLIALEEKAISGADDPLKWDGQVHDLPDWNKDQTLASAFKVSCVWCFQTLARRVGAARYPVYLRDSGYGALREPFEETSFWLDGALEISAVEQVEFLRKVYRRALPFSASSYDTLGEIMRVEQAPAYTLWAKTGWATRVTPPVGWYVGYVETANDVWFFATNIETRDEKALPLRRRLTLEALRAKSIVGAD